MKMMHEEMKLVCPNCGDVINDRVDLGAPQPSFCPKCGYNLRAPKAPSSNVKFVEKQRTGATRKMVKALLALSIILILIGGALFTKGAYVKNVYKNYTFTSANAYVGGDAYNYIINASYFSGYMAAGGACIVSACTSFGFSCLLRSKAKVDDITISLLSESRRG